MHVTRESHPAFVALLVLALAIRLAFVLALPFGQQVAFGLEGLNDEPAHFNYVKQLAAGRGFPVQTHHVWEPGAFERADFEYYQPPLFYLTCAPLVGLLGDPAGRVACRLVSFACGVLSLVVLGRILAAVGASTAARQLGIVFVALLPSHAYFSSVVSNDAMCWLFCLMLVLALIELASSATDGAAAPLGTHVSIGVLIALATLSKSAGAILIPLVIGTYVWLVLRTRDRRVAVGSIVALGLAAAIAGPWHARNLATYHSLFAIEAGWGPPRLGGVTTAGIVYLLKSTVATFWFPMQHVSGGVATNAIRIVGALVLAAQALLTLAYLRGARPRGAGINLLFWLLAVVLAAHVRMGLSWPDIEGRFLFPALAAIAFFFVVPTLEWFERGRGGERAAWVVVTLVALHPYALLAFGR